MDETYQTYVNRVARLALPEAYASQVEHIQESPKFKSQSTGGRIAAPFPGYSVITPPWEEDPENETFYTALQECQQYLLQHLDAGLMVPVPPESFHLTIADLIWDSAYQDACQNPNFEQQLHENIAQCFGACQPPVKRDSPIRWLLLGLMLRTRAIAVCLIPTEESAYKQMVEVRRSIYQNQGLMALGIEQQYHFTAHITLGYFGNLPPDFDRQRFCNLLLEFNQKWLDFPEALSIRKAELRKFDDMTRYYRQPDWPVLEF